MLRNLLALALLSVPALAAAATSAEAGLGAADKAAAFKAAGFSVKGGEYVRCDDTVTASREPGSLEVADLNGDGRPEAFVKEGSTHCYGNTGVAFVLLTKQANGTWKVLLDQVGIPVVSETRHMGWPDIEVGGPGFEPFPTYRFNGTIYAKSR
jgi:ketosteroid isomerase-like protein